MGGKPSKGTSKDSRNKGNPLAKGSMPVPPGMKKKGGFKPFPKKGAK